MTTEAEMREQLEPGMVKISKLIADFQKIKDDFGDTCVYVRPGVSWGACALNRQAADEKAIKENAANFAAKFKPEYRELAEQIMGHAISEGWHHQSAQEQMKPLVEALPEEPTEAMINAMAWASARENAPTHGMFSEEQVDEMVERNQPAHKPLMRAAYKALRQALAANEQGGE